MYQLINNNGLYQAFYALNGTFMSDNPINKEKAINLMYKIIQIEVDVCKKYRLMQGGYSLLIKITHSWLIDNKGMTVYGLCNGVAGRITQTARIVNDLMRKGLIEIVGSGSQNARVYGPSHATLVDLKLIDSLMATA